MASVCFLTQSYLGYQHELVTELARFAYPIAMGWAVGRAGEGLDFLPTNLILTTQSFLLVVAFLSFLTFLAFLPYRSREDRDEPLQSPRVLLVKPVGDGAIEIEHA